MNRRRRNAASVAKRLFAAIAVGLLSASLAGPTHAQAGGAQEPKPARKRALLVGISKYERKGSQDEWRHLNTELDLELLQGVLTEKFKFDEIVVLRDEKATKGGILKALRDLVADTSKGDVVFFHFSGHGDSIPDDNGDEVDGKDESLIPFDYVSRKDSSKNIRDDEIGKILDELKKKEPGNVTVSIDSCYSGTATRGDYAARGDGGGGDAVKPESESPSGLLDKSASYPRDYVFLAASSPRQTAKETEYDGTRRMGVYTLALVKALSDATPRTTYRDLFERINDIITSKRGDQNPQLEGAQDVLVFKGTAVRQERYVGVSPLSASKPDDRAILRTGSLVGATAGSRFALYEAGTKDPKDKDAVKLAEGELTEADATTSVIKLDRPLEPEKLRTARAFETQHFYEETTLKVYLQDLRRIKGGEAALSELTGGDARGSAAERFSLAEFKESKAGQNLGAEAYDVKVYPAGEREVRDRYVPASFSGLVMERKDGSMLASIPEGSNISEAVRAALERENRFRTIKGLKDTEDPRLKVGLRLVPVDVELDAAGRVTKATPKGDAPRDAGGRPVFRVGDYFMMEVENRGDLDLHVTILDLRPDGKIGPGFPQDVAGTPDNLIKRGTIVLLPVPYVFSVTEPLGEESFRAIATVEPTDFTPLIDEELIAGARGAGRGGEDPVARLLKEVTGRGARGDSRAAVNNAAQSPLGRILLASAVGTRSGLAASAPPSWATSSFTFVVKPK
jgi:metacaspase-1